MSRAFSHVKTAVRLVSSFTGDMPFAPYSKAFFSDNKQMGSRDRKTISALAYHYFRMSKAWPHLPLEHQMVLAHICLATEADFTRQQLLTNPEWQHLLPLYEQWVGQSDPVTLFPFGHLLSAGIPLAGLATSYLHQPRLFLRIRPGRHTHVCQTLERQGIAFAFEEPGTVSLANATQVPESLQPNLHYVVQDSSSQQTGWLIQQWLHQLGAQPSSVWDVCAASGGKSIMLHDVLPPHQLVVSDIRASILANLRRRLAEARIEASAVVQANLEEGLPALPQTSFDLVLTDVPCSGSGTWARTPEQLWKFTEEDLSSFPQRQLKIARNAAHAVAPGGVLVYVTCSVFAVENEAIVAQLCDQSNLKLLHQQVVPGFDHGADTMFIAMLQRPFP